MKIPAIFFAFLSGCITVSLLGWLAQQHPALGRGVALLGLVAAITWLGAWFVDDPLADFFKVPLNNLYATLIAAAAAILLGGFVVFWI